MPAVPATAVEAAPRSERGRRTREALLRAAREVFEQRGYLDARTTDIADAAGVAHGSFYTYFRDKEEALAAVLAEVQEEVLRPAAAAGASGDETPLAAIEAGHRAYLTAYRRNARLMAAMEQAALVSEHVRGVRVERARAFARRNARAIARWQASGLADPALDPLQAAHALDAMASRLAEMVFVHGQRMSLDELVALLTRMWAGALGIKQTDKEKS